LRLPMVHCNPHEQGLMVDSFHDYGLAAMIWINMTGRQPSLRWSFLVRRGVA
jgi:hypothetical protein